MTSTKVKVKCLPLQGIPLGQLPSHYVPSGLTSAWCTRLVSLRTSHHGLTWCSHITSMGKLAPSAHCVSGVPYPAQQNTCCGVNGTRPCVNSTRPLFAHSIDLMDRSLSGNTALELQVRAAGIQQKYKISLDS